MDELTLFLSKFREFKEFLIKTNIFDDKTLSELLSTTEENDCEKQLEIIIENIESKDRETIDRFAAELRNSGLISRELLVPTDQSDGFLSESKSSLIRLKDLLSSPKACGEEIIVQKAHKIKRNKFNDIYPMISSPRGYCLLIDNHRFNVPEPNTTNQPNLHYRKGSRADADRLYDVFSQLFFHVLRLTNQTAKQMKDSLYNLSKNENLVIHDALAVIILSHGSKSGIYGSDGDTIEVDTILEMFNNENCPDLRNKPKMFFLSACRGDKIDSGVNLLNFSTIQSLGPTGGRTSTAVYESLNVPTWSDMFVYYSTINGYASIRNNTSGSWFGYELANCLAEFAHREHLNDLITIKVSERVHKRITQIKGNVAKQAIDSEIKGYVKKLYFNPGLSKETN